MALKLYYHPLSSYCWKALIGLYELEIPFEPVLVDLGDEASRAAFLKVWPVGKFPVIENTDTGEIVPETSVILEYLDRGRSQLIPADAKAGLEVRLSDRILDLHVHEQMGRIVFERLRPADAKDPFGEAAARRNLAVGYGVVESRVTDGWLSGERFGMADCAALPALHYGNRVLPFEETHPRLMAYLKRLEARSSVQRVLKEAEPYFHMYPQG